MPKTAKEAVEIAIRYVADIYAREGVEVKDVLLEELELTDDDKVWSVTVSFLRPTPPTQLEQITGNIGALLGKQGKRVYKSVLIDADIGKVRAMKIRDLGSSAGRS